MKRNSQLKSLKDLVSAYPSGIKINYLKYRDMSQLLRYIPIVHYEFYKGIRLDKSEKAELYCHKRMWLMRNEVMLSL